MTFIYSYLKIFFIIMLQGDKINLGSNIQKKVTQERNYFMHGDLFILTKMQKH